jgi:hypothetical protein
MRFEVNTLLEALRSLEQHPGPFDDVGEWVQDDARRWLVRLN